MSDRWIDLQLDHLRRNMDRPYRVYADLEGVDPQHAERFDVAVAASDGPTVATMAAAGRVVIVVTTRG